MHFGGALELLKKGAKLRRPGPWEDYDMYLKIHEDELRCFSQGLPLDELCLGGGDLLAEDWETVK